MDAIYWIYLLTVGFFVGAVGQGVRVIVGLKKLSDTAANTNASVADLLEAGRLLISLLIGGIAGVLAAIGMQEAAGHTGSLTLTTQDILSIAGAGYVGADFIEAFMRRVAPSATGSPAANDGDMGNPTTAATSDGSVG